MVPLFRVTNTCKAQLLLLNEDQLLEFDQAVRALEVYDWSGSLPLKRHPLFATRFRWRLTGIEISFEVVQHRTGEGKLLRVLHTYRGVYVLSSASKS